MDKHFFILFYFFAFGSGVLVLGVQSSGVLGHLGVVVPTFLGVLGVPSLSLFVKARIDFLVRLYLQHRDFEKKQLL
jgi:hypothetical protein